MLLTISAVKLYHLDCEPCHNPAQAQTHHVLYRLLLWEAAILFSETKDNRILSLGYRERLLLCRGDGKKKTIFQVTWKAIAKALLSQLSLKPRPLLRLGPRPKSMSYPLFAGEEEYAPQANVTEGVTLTLPCSQGSAPPVDAANAISHMKADRLSISFFEARLHSCKAEIWQWRRECRHSMMRTHMLFVAVQTLDSSSKEAFS